MQDYCPDKAVSDQLPAPLDVSVMIKWLGSDSQNEAIFGEV